MVFPLRSAFWLKNIKGRPEQEKLKDILKIFQANHYPLKINNQEVSWHLIATHALNVFLRNCKTDLHQKSLSTVNKSKT